MRASLSDRVQILSLLSKDFLKFASGDHTIPAELTYSFKIDSEPVEIESFARKAALLELSKPTLKKVAFDTRHINQQTERNPRANLQYFHRSQEFLDTEDEEKMKVFAMLIEPLEEIKSQYQTEPEYFNSFARQLYDNVHNIFKLAEINAFKPQLEYLSQILYLRYRLTPDMIKSASVPELKQTILKKDENLLKRATTAQLLQSVRGDTAAPSIQVSSALKSDGNASKSTQESIVNAIFGMPLTRKEGEKTITRTITIQLTDKVED